MLCSQSRRKRRGGRNSWRFSSTVELQNPQEEENHFGMRVQKVRRLVKSTGRGGRGGRGQRWSTIRAAPCLPATFSLLAISSSHLCVHTTLPRLPGIPAGPHGQARRRRGSPTCRENGVKRHVRKATTSRLPAFTPPCARGGLSGHTGQGAGAGLS